MARFDCIAVYIMASGRNGTIYVGVTSDLEARVGQHRTGAILGFTQRYACKHLVWFETHGEMAVAIRRETALKRYNRAWKIRLIEAENPSWRDLADGWWAEG